MMRKADFDDGWTRLPELVERSDGAKPLPSPENDTVLAGRIAWSLKSAFVSRAPRSAHPVIVS